MPDDPDFRMHPFSGAATALTLLCLASLAGCGSDNSLGRLPISGEILLDGQPLNTGSIEFSPHGYAGITTGAIIEQGAYAIPANKGIPPGKYLVRIFSPVETAAAANKPGVPAPAAPGPVGPSQPPPGVERIPPTFNTESKEVVEVTLAGPNRFDFKIQTR